MRNSVQIDGFEKLDRKMRKLADAATARVKQRALDAGGEIIAGEARALVPVDSGQLRESIAVGERAVGFAASRSGDDLAVFVGPHSRDGFYGQFLEFGTVNMAARPWLRPAYDNSEGEVRSVMADILRGAVRDSVR